MHKYLVVGGAGYIGRVCVDKLLARGDEVVIIDSLQTGREENVNKGARFYQGRMGDAEFVRSVFEKEPGIEAVFQFAGLIQVGESVKTPGKYYTNNFAEGIVLLEAMREAGVGKIIFSSTAAVFGIPQEIPITEDTEKSPINPYGESKLFFEKALLRYHEAYGLRFTVFRYFNACGSTENAHENHVPETHLIPIIMEVAEGMREELTVNGNDYNTPDGTCIRDYVHVEDLVDAHLLALKRMETEEMGYYNLGNGNGYSILEVIRAVEKVKGVKIKMKFGARREGDPDRLIASSERAKKELGWKPKFQTIESIIETIK